ncbi:hypothetical protein ABS71_16405 [bacterium SCN 62-11]|nr:MAG: hypothetical protein ABS71_16405 [bacterium SCN 62-11]
MSRPLAVNLVVQTAEEMLYVPAQEIASLMPTYPRRWRVVLADGRVGHRTGPLPDGPWVPLADGWVRPEHLTRDGDFWRDPAGFLYAYTPLHPAEDDEEEEDELPPGLLAVEYRDKKWIWRTETEESECELSSNQLREVFPDLVKIDSRRLIDLRRVRKFGNAGVLGWVQLDQGERFEVSGRCNHALAARLGLESLSTQDLDVLGKIWKLRDFPYDLTSADPAQILQDHPDKQTFAENLLWQTVVHFEHGQPNDYGRNIHTFLLNPLMAAGARCGYTFTLKDLRELIRTLVFKTEVLQLRQLGFTEKDPGRRKRGHLRPDVLLLAPVSHRQPASQAAEAAGVSLLLTGDQEQLALEFLAAELQGPLQILEFDLKPGEAERLKNRFERWELECPGPTAVLHRLEDLPQALPQQATPQSREPFRRIPLESYTGLVYVNPEDILSWSPTPPSRWRVELKDGRVFHHPGPVPPAPPAATTTDPTLWLESRNEMGVWHLEDGSEVDTGIPYAATQHPSLAALTRTLSANYQRIQSSSSDGLVLDGGQSFALPRGTAAQRWLKIAGVPSFSAFGPDSRGLRFLEIRDVPYEIARAEAEKLRADFSGLLPLMANVLWQVGCGRYRYGDGFAGFFYRPMQATLYRAGYLTRRQLERMSVKDRIYLRFCNLVTKMVKVYRLFDYDQLGFSDPFPENRILGERQPQRILLLEKGDRIAEWGRLLQQEFGMTLLQTQGNPSLLAVKYLREALKPLSEVEIYFYGDFDQAGWDMPTTLRNHLRFYGCECTRIERLVLASVFTPEEQELYSRALLPTTTEGKSRVARFVRESGGVQGQARGIHANWLQPYERLVQRWRELTE